MREMIAAIVLFVVGFRELILELVSGLKVLVSEKNSDLS